MFGFARRDDDNGRDQQQQDQQDQLDQQDDDRSVRPKTPLHLPANTLLRMDRFEEGGGRRESGGGVGEGARGAMELRTRPIWGRHPLPHRPHPNLLTLSQSHLMVSSKVGKGAKRWVKGTRVK